MGEESSRTHDVFLSYSSKDKTWADSACAVLEQHRIRCWIAPRDMTPGDEWAAGIIKGLNASRIMVLIFSDHANASKQVRKEVERAISKDLPVLAFRIQNVAPKDAMEFNLSNIHWLDAFTPPVERQLELLAASVKNSSAVTPSRSLPAREPVRSVLPSHVELARSGLSRLAPRCSASCARRNRHDDAKQERRDQDLGLRQPVRANHSGR